MFLAALHLRICPGMHFAELAVFMIVVSTLASVDVLKALDANGREIPVTEKRTGTVARYVAESSTFMKRTNGEVSE